MLLFLRIMFFQGQVRMYYLYACSTYGWICVELDLE